MGAIMYRDKVYGAGGSGGGGSSTLAGLSDVNLSSPTDGQVLVYDDANDEWVNANPTGGASAISDLTDVDLDNLSDGQILKWNGITEKWENADESGGDEAIVLTMAEYNALTPEQQADPTKTYYITDAPGGGGVIDYSTTEQNTGQKWIDGKPIYQITVELSTAISISANSWANTTISRTGVDNIIDVKAYKKNTNFFGNVMGAIDTSYNYLRIGNARNSAISIDSYTFQYTKTTDIAS